MWLAGNLWLGKVGAALAGAPLLPLPLAHRGLASGLPLDLELQGKDCEDCCKAGQEAGGWVAGAVERRGGGVSGSGSLQRGIPSAKRRGLL